MTYRKKLIEVALPLDAINKESAREKSIRHGHPSTLHLWWSRKPLAACRAVLFAQLVDDPGEYMPDEKSADEERERLFDIIEELVKWENINNEEVLDGARLEIARSVARDLGEPVPVGKEAIREFLATKAPPVLDPFAGGGSIPLEAQRLGLRAYATDLNPVAALINKAMIEVPNGFANLPPFHPPEINEQQLSLINKEWIGTEGLSEDVQYYGKLLRNQAEKQIGYLYPMYSVTRDLLDLRPDLRGIGLNSGEKLKVIAWLWARTVKCPNPVCGASMPLTRSFELSTKKSKRAWAEPKIDRQTKPPQISITVKVGKGGNKTFGTVTRNGARCIACDTPVSLDYIRQEGQVGNLGVQLLAIVADTQSGRVYLPPVKEHEEIVKQAVPLWKPDTELPERALGFRVQLYGMDQHYKLFTNRQLVALSTLSDLVKVTRNKIIDDIKNFQRLQNKNFLREEKIVAYANAVSTYLGLAVSKTANTICSLVTWSRGRDQTFYVFSRQALPMNWDFADVNPFADAAGDIGVGTATIAKSILNLPVNPACQAFQHDAMVPYRLNDLSHIICTDPPYYDNIGYADLSDFFYVWLRYSLGDIYPNLFSTILVPKSSELISLPFRFDDNKELADNFFEGGLRKAFRNVSQELSPYYPMAIFYAFKQAEAEEIDDNEFSENNIVSTGWETMLEGLLTGGFQINGTWPMRTERPGRLREKGSNALASSIVLVCRPRITDANKITRREFIAMLKKELPHALRQLQQGSIAPVDLAQAAIGPGMAVFSRYKQVLEADGSPMSVRTALALINQALDEFLAEQEGEYDTDTRWALAWYEQYGFNEGPFGVAETLSKAKNTSVGGLEEAGVLIARAGKVRLLSRTELKEDWDPSQDKRPTAWEAVQYLIQALDAHGEQGAALLLSRLGGLGETARDLAYRLYTICERKGWAQDALGYNMLVVAWPRLKEMARRAGGSRQEALL